MKIISGSTTVNLAKKIAQKFKFELVPLEVIKFPEEETRIRLTKQPSKQVIIIQSLQEPVNNNFVELLLMLNASTRNGTKEIFLILPYFGYSRQDHAYRAGEAVGAEMVARALHSYPIKKIITVDLHTNDIKKYYNFPVVDLSPAKIFVQTLFKLKNIKEKGIIVAPDEGAYTKAIEFAKDLKLPVMHIEKERNLLTGDIKVLGSSSEISVLGKITIIVDDIISTGDTIIEAHNFLHRQGAKSILVCATHPVFTGKAIENLKKAKIRHIYVTDSIILPKKKKIEKITVISIAPLLIKAIKDI